MDCSQSRKKANSVLASGKPTSQARRPLSLSPKHRKKSSHLPLLMNLLLPTSSKIEDIVPTGWEDSSEDSSPGIWTVSSTFPLPFNGDMVSQPEGRLAEKRDGSRFGKGKTLTYVLLSWFWCYYFFLLVLWIFLRKEERRILAITSSSDLASSDVSADSFFSQLGLRNDRKKSLQPPWLRQT